MKNLIMITIALFLFSSFAYAQGVPRGGASSSGSSKGKTGLTYKYVCQNINGTNEGMTNFSAQMNAMPTNNNELFKTITSATEN